MSIRKAIYLFLVERANAAAAAAAAAGREHDLNTYDHLAARLWKPEYDDDAAPPAPPAATRPPSN